MPQKAEFARLEPFEQAAEKVENLPQIAGLAWNAGSAQHEAETWRYRAMPVDALQEESPC